MGTLEDKLHDALFNRLIMEFEDALVQKISLDVPDYDGSIAADEESINLCQAREAYIEALIDDLLGEEEY